LQQQQGLLGDRCQRYQVDSQTILDVVVEEARERQRLVTSALSESYILLCSFTGDEQLPATAQIAPVHSQWELDYEARGLSSTATKLDQSRQQEWGPGRKLVVYLTCSHDPQSLLLGRNHS
jgi:hypothetical protein